MTEITEDEMFSKTLPEYADCFEDVFEYHRRYAQSRILKKEKDDITLATSQLWKYLGETSPEYERWLNVAIDLVNSMLDNSFMSQSPHKERTALQPSGYWLQIWKMRIVRS